MNIRFTISLIMLYILFSCNCEKQDKVDISRMTSYSDDGHLKAVIEIPAGTNHKIEYDYATESFVNDVKEGKERIISFLPYLGNYGFIPGTLSDPNNGGDGDAIDLLVLSESVKTGSIIEIEVIGMLKLIDDNEEDFKIIAIPFNKEDRIIDVENFSQLQTNYPEMILILEKWFLSYDKNDPARIEGWGDEKEALGYIQKNIK